MRCKTLVLVTVDAKDVQLHNNEGSISCELEDHFATYGMIMSCHHRYIV